MWTRRGKGEGEKKEKEVFIRILINKGKKAAVSMALTARIKKERNLQDPRRKRGPYGVHGKERIADH